MDETDSHDANFAMAYGVYHVALPSNDGQPYLEIVEQPQSRGFRFRYECEGKSHGGLQGETSRREKRSYPSVRICNYYGPARITVSLVTDEKEPKPHAHELIGKNCSNGTCTISIKSDGSPVSFPNLGIRHVTKKSVSKILTDRLRETLKADKMMEGELGQDADHIKLTDVEEEDIFRQAEMQAKGMPLSVVRLSFRAYLHDSTGMCHRVLPPVISVPIYDSKAPCAALLKICRMDKVGGSCTGNEEVFLLCDKVQRDDIAVRFYEQDDEGNVKWEDYGNFANHDVHRQYAIVFRTPAYCNVNIDRPVAVHVQLRRFSDSEVSDPKTFTYYPQQTDLEDIQKKRRKQIPNFTSNDGFMSSLGGRSLPPTFNFASQDMFRSFQANGHATSQTLPTIPLSVPSRLEEDSVPNFVPCYMQPILHQTLVGRGCMPSSKDPVTIKDEDEVALVSHKMMPDLDDVKRQMSEAPARPQAAQLPADHQTSQAPARPQAAQSPADYQTSQAPARPQAAQSSANHQTSQTPARPPQTDKMDSNTQTDTCQEMVLRRLLENMALRTAESVSTYAQTSDARHLLFPARQLIKVPNADGDNAVHLSIIHCQRTAAENLLSVLSTLPSDMAVNDRNDLLQSPLQLAVITRQPDLVGLLLSHGADPVTVYDCRSGDTLLHLAARSGNDACLYPLLCYWPRQVPDATNYNEHWQSNVNRPNFEGFTALQLAVRGGHLSCVKLLTSFGHADVNEGDGQTGRTALHHAVLTDNLAIVGYLLLECLADVDKPDSSGNTAMHLAVVGGKLGITALLIAANADADTENYGIDSEDSDLSADEDEYSDDEQTDGPVENKHDEVTDQESTGKTPRQLAAGDDKMLRILSGESYSSVKSVATTTSSLQQDVTADVPLKSVCDSGIDSILDLEKSDLVQLDAMVRMKLSKLLDPVNAGSDWRELAAQLGFSQLIGVCELQRNPTLTVLDSYELADGSVAQLRRCLLDMKRDDAVKLLDDLPAAVSAKFPAQP